MRQGTSARSKQSGLSNLTSASSLSPSASFAHPLTTAAKQEHRNSTPRDLGDLPPHTTLGQLSYAPATQTTVVTTTTTTTTSFPPLVLKPPRHLHELDPKQYPLALSPTPQSLKKLCFDVGGTPTYFQEAEDTSDCYNKLRSEHAALQACNGSLRTVRNIQSQFETPKSRSKPALMSSGTSLEDCISRPQTRSRKRPASPVSISEAAEIARIQRRGRRRRAIAGKSLSLPSDAAALAPQVSSQSVFRNCSTPSTPGLAQNASPFSTLQAHEPRQQSQTQNQSDQDHPRPYSPDEQQDTPLTLSPQVSTGKNVSFADDEDTSDTACNSTDRGGYVEREDLSGIGSGSVAAATPPVADGDADPQSAEVNGEHVAPAHTRTSPSVLEISGSQDVSLPSPSLSPVTAALHHGNHRDYSNTSEDDDVDSIFELDPLFGHERKKDIKARRESTRPAAKTKRLAIRRPDEAEFSNEQLPTPTMMEIPSMLESFDAMPTDMQTYLMYQFLRRCPKSTLQLVAEVVNPALKCDFLGLLPLELSLNIVRHLDFTSLCRAAGVSKKWRHIVNSDEKAWKELFDNAGYTLPEGELRRAIKEGWGWQHPDGTEDFERDLSSANLSRSDSESSTRSNVSVVSSVGDSEALAGAFATPQSGRPKRKAAAKFSSRKQLKRKVISKPYPEEDSLNGWLQQLSIAEGPYAAATAAAVAVPNPSVGLPSLKNLHLYKSIYRRHHLIRKSWMVDDAKPRHIAFRAHQRHVVTCLQFDTDKILTGSDDTNINVYDTKTGALRARLEGHEGGVWALQYEGNVLVSGSTDRSVRVWDIEQARCTQVFHGHTSTVRCLQILMPTEVGQSANGSPIMMPKQPLIITGSRDSNLRVWKLPQPGDKHYLNTAQPQNDTDCPYFLRVLTGHIHSVRAIAAHGDTLVSGSYDSFVRVWKISTGETLHRLQGHTSKVYSVVLDHQRNRCISGSMDTQVKVWSLDTGAVLYNLEGHTSLVGLLDLSHDRLVSAAADSTLRIWDPENGQCKSTLSAHTGAITCFQHDGQKVISGSDRSLKMWNVKTGECVKNLLTDLSGVWQVRFNDRRCVAAVQRNNLTYIEVLDFGASRDGIPEDQRGKRIVVNAKGREITDVVDGLDDTTATD
ncbi:MAG: SCF ubiquitin ligase complex subunit cdc4 [Sclerophora amabilis]|nr:MAG: SCF ubiquitin ligase complex subunit cdc4 [Sclerophora amabilis]